MINAGAVRVPEGAGFNPGLEITVAPQLTKFQNAITTHQAGYVYVWVSNESENTKVWFDDLKVTHRSSRVTQATDYYAWGNVMRENKSPEDVRYRYGYQGQFAEKDEETGWNHFELREYDAVIGRWLVVDPKKQYYSPYLSMGNNPLLRVDPDGGDDWIPQVDKNGKTSYVAEAGDNFDTFVQQFNVSEFDALEYFANSGYSGLEGPFSLSSIKEGTRIDAPFLQLNLKMTDGGWFKSDSWSKKMQQQAINHVAFAFEHAKRNGMSEFSVGKIFNFNKMDFSGGTGINFSGTMNMGGVNVPVRVEMVIMWNSTISIHPTPKPVHDDQMINYNFFHPGKGNPDYKGYIQVPAKYESQAHSFFFNK
jgi:RHS repeat-associated protein